MKYAQIKRRIANPLEGCFYRNRYAIANEFGFIAFVHADCEGDALDIAADSGHLDSERMSEEDFNECAAMGWDDSYILLGNASEPFHSHYLSITQI